MSREGDMVNHTNQMNPQHDAYWLSRGVEPPG